MLPPHSKPSCRPAPTRVRGWWPLAVWCLALFFAPGLHAEEATSGSQLDNVTPYLGRWIWDRQTLDKQTCRFWKTFVIPPERKVTSAVLYITADNGYYVFLDGREIGRGSDWRTVTQYELKLLLTPGVHVLGVEGFNDRLEAGVIVGLHIQFKGQTMIDILSDATWRVAPLDDSRWLQRKTAPSDWPAAVAVVSGDELHPNPWAKWPIAVVAEPALQPLTSYDWQTWWFQTPVLVSLLLAVAGCVWFRLKLSMQSKAQNLLQVERVRIARDIHDDLGSQLTQLVLYGEVAKREQPEDSSARLQFSQVCLLARNLSQAMDEVVWAVNARRDTLGDFVNYVCKHAQFALIGTAIRSRLDVELDLPDSAFDLPLRRNLFLAVKEALNNAVKYSKATELFLRIYRDGQKLIVVVDDNGRGFDPTTTGTERNGLLNMRQRMEEIGGVFDLFSHPGAGCRVTFVVPLQTLPRRAWFQWFRRRVPMARDVPYSQLS